MAWRTMLAAAAMTMAVAGPAQAARILAARTEVNPSSARCIAMVLPSVRGAAGSATEAARTVRDLFVSYLTGPSIRPLALEARLVSQAVEEARQHACDRLLVVTLTRKHHGGGLMGRALGRAADTASWGIPARGVAGAVARGTTAGVAEAVSALAASTRANDELELRYELRPLEGSSIVTKTNKARAHDDQEDLLTPLVEQAATAIAAALGEPL